MQIFPVLDLLESVVVRAVEGKRGNYRPVVSQLASDTAALAVARAFRTQLGLNRLYLADLDAILHGHPNFDAYTMLHEDGFEVMVDAGIRSVDDVCAVLRAGATTSVVGLETLPGPDLLAELCGQLGPAQIVFSLDLRGGVPMGLLAPWDAGNPLEIAARAIDSGVRRMIVLDLASVGTGRGVSTRELCQRIRALPIRGSVRLELITGGGVRQIDDLKGLEEAGIDGVLVASALHDGQITRGELERLAAGIGRS